MRRGKLYEIFANMVLHYSTISQLIYVPDNFPFNYQISTSMHHYELSCSRPMNVQLSISELPLDENETREGRLIIACRLRQLTRSFISAHKIYIHISLLGRRFP